ncbi:coiled-coil domain-containing protein 183-like [Calypte anna]|uniref:coiled-coil domain-containing protein 183-like n=1 Tax=Calypte anna TaxID=9244 RepID=UPI0011C35278|nr:coiled-coil domain-containing protein 183-like [Calypte anna]
MPGQEAVVTPRGAGAALAAGPEGRGRSTGTTPVQKAKHSQRAQELRNFIALQEQGRKLLTQMCEEKLRQRRELLPGLREALQDDAHALAVLQKSKNLPSFGAHGSQNLLDVALARKTVEEAEEMLQAQIHHLVRKSDLVLHEVRQQSQAWDELQRWLQQLQDATKEDKRLQAQGKVIRQLQNKTGKMVTKVQAGQRVTRHYLTTREALKRVGHRPRSVRAVTARGDVLWRRVSQELAHLPAHLDVLSEIAGLYHGELQDTEVLALHACKAAGVTQEALDRMETEVFMESEFRQRSLAAKKLPGTRQWLKEAREKRRRGTSLGFLNQEEEGDSLDAVKLEAAKSKMQSEALWNEKMGRAKAALQCSHPWDVSSGLLMQQTLSTGMEHIITHSPCRWMDVDVFGCRGLEEELQANLQQEEARLEHMRSQVLRNQEVQLQFTVGTDSLLASLHGITVDGQDSPVKTMGVEEKLQHCGQKLQYLVQQVATSTPPSQSPNEEKKTLVKIQKLLEKTAVTEGKNLRISLEGTDDGAHQDYSDRDSLPLLTREDIKNQGLLLIESKTRKRKK